MAAVTKTTSGSLEKAAQTLAGHAESYSSLKSSLESLLESSSSSFQGQAASAFQSAGSEWASANAKTTAALTEIYEKLKKAADKYTSTDQDEAKKHQGTGTDTGADKGAGTDKNSDKTTGNGSNPADVAEKYNGKNTHDLKTSGALPMDKSQKDDTVDCANFVSATLQQSGQINWHTNAVADLSQRLQSDGWVTTTTPSKGDVAIVNGNEHTELVHSNVNGKVTLIGSNNSNSDGTQSVGFDTYTPTQSGVVYLHKK